jgi:hypothetical protein
MNRFETMVNMIKGAYIEVYGVEKWESLTNQEKRDAIMFIAKDLSKAIA